MLGKLIVGWMAGLSLTSASAAPLYSSGTVNGTISASTFGRNFEVTTPFRLEGDAAQASATIGLWAPVNVSPLTISWKLGSTAFGDELGNGVSSVSSSFVRPLSFGGGDYWLFEAAFDVSPIKAGVYFLTLHDASLNGDGYLMWDIAAAQYIGAQQRGDAGWHSNIYSPTLTINEVAMSVPEPGSLALVMASLLVTLHATYRRDAKSK